jgi:hypothetical protein
VTGTPANTERWKRLVLILTLVNTVLAAVIVGLQADAGIRAATANRDSQYDAILASGMLFKSGLQSTYDMNTYSEVLKNTQESLVMQYTALDQEQKGNKDEASASDLQGKVAQARADKAKAFSVFYANQRYAPATDQDPPNFEAYMKDMNADATDLVARQNAAADGYQRWNNKSDAYVAVLTVLAIAFFLLGLAQSVTPRLRLAFAVFALTIMGIGGVWTGVILLS